jgi:dTDP-L-rhamnose 4-epimerase
MAKNVLITGGAGFIGSHLADELLRAGHRVTVLDNLLPQVHGSDRERPKYLDKNVELIVGDVRDRTAVERAVARAEVVYHLAALVGVGQSMYEMAEYTAVNNLGTTVLLEALVKHRVERLVVASSMSVYGEGLYAFPQTSAAAPRRVGEGSGRSLEQLKRGEWELFAESGERLSPVPTPESKTPSLESVYALSKYDQERLCLMVGRAYGIPAVALRFFNVFGPRQALSNPYTGVLAIFASRLLNGHAPSIFEDGLQQRDFVSVYDIARACRLALERPDAVGGVFNIGSGEPRTILDVALQMARALGKPSLLPELTGKYRMGDVRHCFADIRAAKARLGYEPRVSFDDGMTDLLRWLDGQVAKDRVADARAELESRGLTL